MELDDDDLELLGFGQQHDSVSDWLHNKRLNLESYKRERKPTPLRPPPSAQVLKERADRRYEHLKNWRAKSKEKYRAIETRYRNSEKGRAAKAAKNRRYYLRKKAEREQVKA